MRGSGMLLPVASLPSKYGIGSFSKSAYEFVDLCAEAGQKYWQILPLGPTSYGDSPYQSFSTFAGNPYFIDLETLIQEGLLTKEECDACDFGDNPHYIDYGKIYENRFDLLRKAYERSKFLGRQEYLDFKKANKDWLHNYGLYMAVKNHFHGVSWNQWDEDIRTRQPEAVERYEDEFSSEIDFYSYLQYLFQKQWTALKAYANSKGIQIIGDIPIYVAFDSADTWANPELFQFTSDGEPIAVAGCPPDGFSATGQLWGNPLYRWDYHEQTGFAWWIRRIRHCFTLYDIVRVDHFRGFDEYYAIPYGHTTAELGKWEKGPGLKLFTALKDALGDMPIIAEDLGFLTPSVLQLVHDTGYPGMKVLEFAFDSREESDYMPHLYPVDSVCYTGTHDNVTLKQWFDEAAPEDVACAKTYLGLNREEGYIRGMIRGCMGSVSRLCVVQMQDYLELGKEARMNFPGTLSSANWTWRAEKGFDSDALAARIYAATKLYGRVGK